MVGDDPNSNHPSRSKAGLLPPRPTEIENSPPPLSTEENRETDAAQDLFEMFQELKKKASHAGSSSDLSESTIWSLLQTWFGPAHLWKWLVTAVIVIATITVYFKQQRSDRESETASNSSTSQKLNRTSESRSPASGNYKNPDPHAISTQLKKYETVAPNFSALTRRVNMAHPMPENNDVAPAPEPMNDPPPENAAPPETAQGQMNEPPPPAEVAAPVNDANPEQEHIAAQPDQNQENSGPDVQTQN